MKPTTLKMPVECLSVELAHESLNEEARTIDLVFYAGENVQRMNWWTGEKYFLQFSLDPSHVRLGRLNRGAPLLDSHNDSSLKHQIGVIERAWIDGGKGKATARFSERADVEPIWQDVKNKIIRNISMGAGIHKLKDVTPEDSKLKHFLATDWEAMEISALPIGAAEGAQFLNQEKQQFTECEVEHSTFERSNQMETTEVGNVEQLRVAAIQKCVRLAGLEESFASQMVQDKVSLEAARTEIFNKLAEKSEANPTRSSSVVVTRDAGTTEMTGLQDMLLHRFNPNKYLFPQGQFERTLTLMDAARSELEIRGVRTNRKRDSEIAQLAFQTTSDHPNLFTATGARRLQDSYAESQQPIKELFRVSDARDFRPKSVVRFQGVSELLEVGEHGEITSAPVHDEAESYSVKQFGRQAAFTDKALRNDDLEALLRLPDEFGKSSARKEADEAVRLLQLNAGLGPVMGDGLNLFDAGHGNLAGSGGAISESTITAGLLAIRLQKNLDSTSTLGLVPRFLMIPATKEILARKEVAVVYPPSTTDVNPHTGSLTVLAESRLDAASTIAWYMAVSPAAAAVFEVSYLDGARGPRIETRAGWDILGLRMRCIHEFGLGVIDWRGIYRNPGA